MKMGSLGINFCFPTSAFHPGSFYGLGLFALEHGVPCYLTDCSMRGHLGPAVLYPVLENFFWSFRKATSGKA